MGASNAGTWQLIQRPVLGGDVGSDNDGAKLVAFGDDLEKEL
jgi:hypothetical protein